jgi:putative DNA primase/helicase
MTTTEKFTFALQTELDQSAIAADIADLNIRYLEQEHALNELCWGLESEDRRNDGRVRDRWISQYNHVQQGGLAFYGVDPLTGERTSCLSFKPLHPKPERKYENPPKVSAQAIYPAVTYHVWQLVAQRFNLPLPSDVTIANPKAEAKEFWLWVIQNNLPVIVTEGAKKAYSAMSYGFPTIALTGLWNWTDTSKDENGKTKKYNLIPSLQPIATPDRSIHIALDRDKKAAANKAVIQSRSALAQCLIERGAKPFSIPWDSDYKGLDDLIAGCGIEALERASAKAEALTGEQPNFKQKPAPNILAEKIAKELRDKLLFDVGGKLWRYFDGGVWHEKTIEEIERFFYERVCLDVPENLPSYIENVVKVAKWKLLQPVWNEVSGLEFIPFKNGVWDVKNRKLLPHDPSLLLTWKLPRNYPTVAGLEFPCIDRFLTQVTKGNQQLKNILIAACNAVLLGRSDLQKAIYLVGGGGNGKGSFLRLLEMLVGLNNCHSTTLHDLCENNFELANIYKKRLIICPDEDKRVGGLSRFKSITGGDSIRGEKKGKDAFRFRYEGMVAIASNDPIFLGDSSYGLSRRLITIPFKYQVPTHERRDLTAEFEVDLPAFTSYLLSLDENAVKSTLLGSSDVAEVRETEWDLTTRTDSIAAFYDDALIFDPAAKTPSSLLYASYQDYCKASGLSAKSIHKFTPDLVELCSIKLGLAVSNHRTREVRQIVGLRFRAASDADERNVSLPLNPLSEQEVTLSPHLNGKDHPASPQGMEKPALKDENNKINNNSHQSVTSVTNGSRTGSKSVTESVTKRHQASPDRLAVGDKVQYIGNLIAYQKMTGKVLDIVGSNYHTTFTTKSRGSVSANDLRKIARST